MHNRLIDNSSTITKNNDDYLGSMRSSRINPKTSFDYDYMATHAKISQHHSKMFDFYDSTLDTACTTKRLIATPVKKQKIIENDSKQTLINSNQHYLHNKIDNPFIMTDCFKIQNDESNKENSNIKSNLFSSESPLTEKEESDSNPSSGFKIPKKKLEFSNNLKQGKYESVRLNLQKTFNIESSSQFFKSKQETQIFNHSLISSSEKSSSQDNTFISKNDNNTSNEKEVMLDHMKEIRMCMSNQPSQTSNTESLVEGLTKKAVFTIPREKTNDEKYKILAIKKIRKSTYKDNKSTTKVDVLMKNCERKDDYPESMIQCNLFDRKRKLIHSVKKIYASEIAFVNAESKETKKFRLYKDSDIGINSDWQKYLKESRADEDVLTDEELVTNATAHVHRNLMESITFLRSNTDSDVIHNFCYMNK